ncbi:cytochrome c [Achromobacter sp. GG226]|uniref:c-type cytochrome n=1 Tax=Verticiella alkaliphila TaxID=2779529 RepID=UPI001C0AAB4A|nr:c-type cytochrome [Verticiella sp. GG226]MBU4611328.1 cytochrome c [Verticiella sp. GG226]
MRALVTPAATADMTTHGAQAFARDCLACHSLDPASRSAQPGPNLADLGLRGTLAAGTLPNTPESLRDWLAHPQARKPGNLMPDQNLSGEDVEAIATFLESLP